MDTLVSMRVFRRVADQHSFSGAAKRDGMSAAMVTKHIANLEAHLGARLFNRTTRRVSLTEAGREYLAHCQDALDLIDAAEASISHARSAPSGTLKITAPVWIANPAMAALFAAFRAQYPDVVLDVQLENRRVDLVAEGYDVALRATADPAPTLIVKPLAVVPFYLVAAPALFGPNHPPTRVSELMDCDAVLPSYVSLDKLTLESVNGKEILKLKPVMYCNDTHLAKQSVLCGVGAAYLPAWLVDEELARGDLIRLLPDHRTTPITLYAAYSSRRYMTTKVRTFIDFLDAKLKEAAWFAPDN